MTSERDSLREEFEAWASSQNWIIDRDSFGDYRHSTARDGWEAWQAARRAQHSTAEPVGEVVLFGRDADLKEVSWRKGRLPPVGTKLFAAPQQAPLTPLTDAQKHTLNPYKHSRGAASIWLNGVEAAERAHGIGAAKEKSNG